MDEQYDYIFDDELLKLSSIYVINNNMIEEIGFREKYVEQLKDCYYIVKSCKEFHRLFVKQKSNYEWLPGVRILYSYDELIDLICKNEDNFICMQGFASTLMSRIIIRMEETRNKNIKFCNFYFNGELISNMDTESKKSDISYCKKIV